MRVLVCGGRNFTDAGLLERTLNRIHSETPIQVLIEGGARGADSLAKAWAESKLTIDVIECPAQWSRDGKAAGLIRNLYMRDVYKPDLVVAFTGGTGTAHMVRVSRERGISVREIKVKEERDA